MKFYLVGSKYPRPESKASIYADGTDEKTYRPGIDLDLSHWIPNQTPAQYKAPTSTEICLKYVAANPQFRNQYDLALNNHLDVDGILSLYVLMRPEFSQKRTQVLTQAAEMGDFFWWGEAPAQVLSLALTEKLNAFSSSALNNSLDQSSEPPLDLMDQVAELIVFIDNILLDHYEPSSSVKKGMQILAESKNLLASNRCRISQAGPHLVSFAFANPDLTPFSEAEISRLLNVQTFNEMVTDRLLVWPNAANAKYPQSLKLWSVLGPQRGWHHDLYVPTYDWADTPELWNYKHSLDFNSAVKVLNSLEKGSLKKKSILDAQGEWVLMDQVHPFPAKKQLRPYPVVLSFIDPATGQPRESSLAPEQIISILRQP